MKKKMVAGNWKMHGNIESIQTLLKHLLSQYQENANLECVVFPPAIYLPLVNDVLKHESIAFGAQNVYPMPEGAVTGELSGSMLNEYGCKYVLVGHSERRRLFAEDEKFIAEKFHHVKDHDMIPVLCIGETLAERGQGLMQEVLTKQLQAVSQQSDRCFKHCVVAYEPVWAIGTGQSACPEDVQMAHAFIRQWVANVNRQDAEDLVILYGGSVNANNARSLFAMPDVDGGLIGGASLDARQFVDIIKCIN